MLVAREWQEVTTMRVGEVELGTPVYLAPMAGVTNEAFRRLCHEQGASVVVSEMVSARALVMGNVRTESMMGVAPDEHPVAIQLFGNEPDIVAEAAQKAEAYGADMVDLNLGCPVEKIVKAGSGAALLRDPEKAARVVERAAKAIRVPFTVKIRAGWDTVTAPEVARRLVDAGARAVAVHCRTRQQQYRGKADWTIVARVREALPPQVPVIGNGDIVSAQDALTVVKHYGADGVMVGRGALGNPWVFREISRALQKGDGDHEDMGPVTVRQRLDMLVRHFGLLRQLQGDRLAVVEIRRHAAHYVKGLPNASQVREELTRTPTAEAFLEAVEAYRERLEVLGVLDLPAGAAAPAGLGMTAEETSPMSRARWAS